MACADFYQLLLRDLIEASSATQATDLQQQLRNARRQAGKAGYFECHTRAHTHTQTRLVQLLSPTDVVKGGIL